MARCRRLTFLLAGSLNAPACNFPVHVDAVPSYPPQLPLGEIRLAVVRQPLWTLHRQKQTRQLPQPDDPAHPQDNPPQLPTAHEVPQHLRQEYPKPNADLRERPEEALLRRRRHLADVDRNHHHRRPGAQPTDEPTEAENRDARRQRLRQWAQSEEEGRQAHAVQSAVAGRCGAGRERAEKAAEREDGGSEAELRGRHGYALRELEDGGRAGRGGCAGAGYDGLGRVELCLGGFGIGELDLAFVAGAVCNS